MSQIILTCGHCGAVHDEPGATCPGCGATPAPERLPARTGPAALVPWRGAMPAVMQGVALAGAGVVLRYVAPKAAGIVVRRLTRRRAQPAGYVVETQIIQRIRPVR